MSAYSIDVGADDFQKKVIDASHQTPVLVDFWAEWCAPCRTLKPILEKLAGEYNGRFILAKLDSDKHQDIAARFGVRGIPNVKAFVGGKMVDEFTGALPEAQIREFIQRLMPSPAEPLRVAAQAARGQGEPDVALSLLVDALKLDPANEAVQLDLADIQIDLHDIDAAKALLGAIEFTARDTDRVRALLARLNLVAAGANADPAPLKARIEADADDLDARLQLANALALAEDYRQALEHLLELVRRDRAWQDEAARKAMLDLFTLLGSDPQHADLVREFRIQLARTLN
ncbi:MAG: tetratricopeptide repeat protein [Sulfuritalea sp.]|nr:tetratricopeptide repeat protein [Sulfuritalea sp.]